jgi:hypothetical protein
MAHLRVHRAEIARVNDALSGRDIELTSTTALDTEIATSTRSCPTGRRSWLPRKPLIRHKSLDVRRARTTDENYAPIWLTGKIHKRDGALPR